MLDVYVVIEVVPRILQTTVSAYVGTPLVTLDRQEAYNTANRISDYSGEAEAFIIHRKVDLRAVRSSES